MSSSASRTRRPRGSKAAPIERVEESLPPALVELALWLADYYGSTPGRALALIAPPKRARRKELPQPAERDSLPGEPQPESLTESQERAVARLTDALAGGGHFLLYGATGSGKTEVYLQAAAAALERGLGVIVLVPEIALAPQTVGRFRARFGDRVAILHSSLSEAERRDERERIASGAAPIVIGARSAVFAPLPRLGLICIDEEHDAAYKQESDPRYDARTVAAKRASLEGAVAVYGSATPRPESWATLERLELGGRIGADLPPVRVVDLRGEAGYPLSAPLLAELGKLAERGGKAILLLNRRGVAPAIHCRACGETRRCPNCDVALVLHRDDALHCHHCGFSEPSPEACPECGSVELARIGAGTQRLERELEQRVPELQRFRLDADCGRQAGRARRDAALVRRRRAGRPDRDADGGQGPPLRGCLARGRDRRGHGPRRPGLPRGGADVPARDPARRHGAGAMRRDASSCRPSSPSRAPSRSPRGTTSIRSSPASSIGAGSSDIRRRGIWCGSS